MTTGNTFVPLTLELIEEGAFKKALDRHIAEAQAGLVEFVETWGERSGKAKAVIDMTIEIECQSIEDGIYSVTPKLKLKMPARPPRTTAAMSGSQKNPRTGETELCMFVRDTGSTPGDPNQMHLPLPEEEQLRSEA